MALLRFCSPAIRGRVLRSWLVVFIATAGVVGCGRPGPPPPPQAANLLVLIADTLRSDVLSCYGGPAETPNLCGLAERGTLFETAYAAAPWTLPSAVTLFSGAPPGRFQLAARARRSTAHLYRVPPRETLLAELLVQRGWQAVRRVENGVAHQGNSMQGFQSVKYSPARARQAKDRWGAELAFQVDDPRYIRVWWLLERLLEAEETDPPFFYLHWIQDSHAAYEPPEHLRSRLAFEEKGLPRDLSFYLGLGHRDRPDRGLHQLRDVGPTLSPAELDFVWELYQREVESVDERIGAILRALDLGGRSDDTLVLFTSDHGEAFGEHGNFLHGVSLQEELVRVPILLAGPGVPAGVRVATPVSHLDVLPTLAAAVGISTEELTTVTEGGRDLRELARGAEADPNHAIFLSSPDRLDEEAIVVGNFKLVTSSEGQDVRLYDLAIDPHESNDIAAQHPDRVDRLQRRLRRLQLAARPDERSEESADALERAAQETEDQLRAIGYID